MTREITYSYTASIKVIKQAILQSRYRAAVLVNREMLMLYFGIGEYISKNSREGSWGTNAIEVISAQLQKELPGLRGFSTTNLKNMRLFYEAWQQVIPNSPNRQLATDDLQIIDNQNTNNEVIIRQMSSDELNTDIALRNFVSIGFSHHIAIITGVKSQEERMFYINNCASGFWSVEKLQYNIKSNLYNQQGSIINNFLKTISEADFRGKALRAFKDEYLLDFVNTEDPDEDDERVLENEIVLNIKKFIMALGTDFTFIGNQHRLIVDERDFFVDLLFFNRKLQSLVAIDLKKKDFRPEYVGKMNFYLSALDEYEKKPHENPSIGIILCKEKSNKIVEFAFRDTSKPMGVATYRTARELPPEYEGILPNAEKLKELLKD
ncbi:MAG: PDDEXK nuclease domain-containing protein [Lentimicrobiaceae bacterium]|nr:PDDEXK nuclease domain-containing protein [Lentimicrobiaceae bacterium]